MCSFDGWSGFGLLRRAEPDLRMRMRMRDHATWAVMSVGAVGVELQRGYIPVGLWYGGVHPSIYQYYTASNQQLHIPHSSFLYYTKHISQDIQSNQRQKKPTL